MGTAKKKGIDECVYQCYDYYVIDLSHGLARQFLPVVIDSSVLIGLSAGPATVVLYTFLVFLSFC